MKIYTARDDRFIPENQIQGVYLHGEIENDMGYDIFSFSEKIEPIVGITELSINNRKCNLYIWESEEVMLYKFRGYLIYSDDEEFNTHAKEKYKNKSNFI